MGSKVLGAILAIGAIILAPYLTTAIIGINGAAVLGATGVMFANSVIAMGIMYVGSSILGLNKVEGIGDTVANSAITANEASGVAAIPIVYGRRKVGARRVFMNVTDNNSKLHIVMAMAEGEIGRIRKVFFDGVLVVDFTIPSAVVTGDQVNGESIDGTENVIVSTKHRNNMKMRYRLGSTTQSAIGYLTGKFPTEWPSTAQCKGVAIAYFELNFNRDVYSAVPQITFEIDGKKIAKVDNLASTYSVAYRGTTANTITYTEPASPYNDSYGANPADVIYDYMTNSLYGKGIDPAHIDIDTFIAAKGFCSTTINADFGADNETFTRYFINGHLSPDDTVYNNIKRLLACFQGYLIFSNGKYQLKINRERVGDELTTSNLFLFDESNIIGRYDLQLGSKQNRFNRVKYSYWDADQDYASNIQYYYDDAYKLLDNGVVLEREIDMPMITDVRQAQYLAATILNQSRFQTTINFTCVYTALEVEIGDIVRLTHTNLGFTDKLFRVLGMSLNQDGTIQVTAVEFDDSVYTINSLPAIPLAGTVTFPDFTTVAPPTSLIATPQVQTQGDGTKIVLIAASWTASADALVTEYEVKAVGTTTSYYRTSGTSISIGPLPNGTYTISVTAINAYGSRSTETT